MSARLNHSPSARTIGVPAVDPGPAPYEARKYPVRCVETENPSEAGRSVNTKRPERIGQLLGDGTLNRSGIRVPRFDAEAARRRSETGRRLVPSTMVPLMAPVPVSGGKRRPKCDIRDWAAATAAAHDDVTPTAAALGVEGWDAAANRQGRKQRDQQDDERPRSNVHDAPLSVQYANRLASMISNSKDWDRILTIRSIEDRVLLAGSRAAMAGQSSISNRRIIDGSSISNFKSSMRAS